MICERGVIGCGGKREEVNERVMEKSRKMERLIHLNPIIIETVRRQTSPLLVVWWSAG